MDASDADRSSLSRRFGGGEWSNHAPYQHQTTTMEIKINEAGQLVLACDNQSKGGSVDMDIINAVNREIMHDHAGFDEDDETLRRLLEGLGYRNVTKDERGKLPSPVRAIMVTNGEQVWWFSGDHQEDGDIRDFVDILSEDEEVILDDAGALA